MRVRLLTRVALILTPGARSNADASALAFALRFQGRKRVHNADEIGDRRDAGTAKRAAWRVATFSCGASGDPTNRYYIIPAKVHPLTGPYGKACSMPSIEWNKQRWGKEHHWSADGDEWSYSFGSASAHWFAFVLPRLHRYLPDITTPQSRIVEIAPGHGRWTQFLLNHCKTLAAYDVSEECVSYCQNRFKRHVNDGTAEFYLTDGLSLSEQDDNVDLVFSFDSLVHVERDVMRSYLIHISRCLRPGRFAFLQHSNLGVYPHLQTCDNGGPYNTRGANVSMATIQADAKEQGLVTFIQEGLNHETQHMNNELADCISVIQKPLNKRIRKNTVVLHNRYYPTMGQITKEFILPYEKYDAT